jgi:uncharacterized protein (DUF427 family)
MRASFAGEVIRNVFPLRYGKAFHISSSARVGEHREQDLRRTAGERTIGLMVLPSRDPVLPGQESVWDYPRPPRVERRRERVQIDLGGERIVDIDDVVRVLETSHPPVYYLPIAAFAHALVPTDGASFCEFKGAARYFDVHGGDRVAPRAAWTYPSPLPGYEELSDRVALYAGPMDRCLIAGEEVLAQPGGFYGGWITANIAGPFKGIPGSRGW